MTILVIAVIAAAIVIWAIFAYLNKRERDRRAAKDRELRNAQEAAAAIRSWPRGAYTKGGYGGTARSLAPTTTQESDNGFLFGYMTGVGYSPSSMMGAALHNSSGMSGGGGSFDGGGSSASFDSGSSSSSDSSSSFSSDSGSCSSFDSGSSSSFDP